ncbi:MAG: hypothetical protein RL030_1793 [Pseudomonadota bacterium]|jgi:hypothetical protein
MIRKAILADLPQIIDLALQSVSHDPLPVVVDAQAMESMGKAMIGNPAHFVWVGVDEHHQVTACVAASVSPGFWFRGLQASVILYFAATPGDGGKLLLQFARWIKSRSGIKFAVFETEPGCDERIKRLLRRLGFNRESANMTFVRSKA